MDNKTNRYRLSVLLFLMVLILPLALLILWSVAGRWPWPDLLPTGLTLRAWRYFLRPGGAEVKTLLSSIALSAGTACLSTALAFPAAKALAQYEVRGQRLIEAFFFLPVIVPPLTVALGMHLQFHRLGLAGSSLGVILIHLVPCLPYSLRILQGAFRVVGKSVEDQARTLGATPLQVFLHVTFPMLMPALVASFSMAFIISFSQYLLSVLIGGGRVITFPMLMLPYIESGDRTMGSVYSLVFIAATLLVLTVFERMMAKVFATRLKGYTYV